MGLHQLNLYGRRMPLIAGFRNILWDNSLQSLYKAGKVGTILWIVPLCSTYFCSSEGAYEILGGINGVPSPDGQSLQACPGLWVLGSLETLP